VEEPERIARASLRRSTIIYSAILGIDLLVLAYIISTGASGAAYVTFTIVGIVGLLLAYNVVQHVRDLGSPLTETEGTILRKWSRADLLIAWHSYYLNVDRAIFKVSPIDYALLNEGMYVKVVHFPRTLSVASIHEGRGPQPPVDGSHPDRPV